MFTTTGVRNWVKYKRTLQNVDLFLGHSGLESIEPAHRGFRASDIMKPLRPLKLLQCFLW